MGLYGFRMVSLTTTPCCCCCAKVKRKKKEQYTFTPPPLRQNELLFLSMLSWIFCCHFGEDPSPITALPSQNERSVSLLSLFLESLGFFGSRRQLIKTNVFEFKPSLKGLCPLYIYIFLPICYLLPICL